MTVTVVTSENLAEFNAQRMGLDAPTEAATAEPVVEQETSSGDARDEAETQEEQTETEHKDEPEKKANPKLEKRFSELTKQREDARREAQQARDAAAALEAKVKDYEARLAPPAPAKDADAKPTPQQFNDAFEYAEALAEWSAENALKNRDKAEQVKRAEAARDQVVKAWEAKQSEARSELSDYEDVVSNSTVNVSDQVREAILESDVGPKIVYFLAKNPEIAEALATKSVVSALREIGKLEAKLSGEKSFEKPVVTPSKATAPISPIRATKAVETALASDGEFHGSYAAWKEARRSGRIK